MPSYWIAGLSVESAVALPGAIARPRDAAAADVRIVEGDVPLSLAGATLSGPTRQLSGNRLLMRIPDVARFLLTDGCEIVFARENATPPDEVAIFLLGTVFGILLHQRGHVVLHASAVLVNGKAVLFCGASGAGKSTMAAALGQAGYPLVTDDLCAIAVDADGSVLVHPDGRQLKLWQQSIEKLGLKDRRGPAVRSRLEKFYVEPDDVFSTPLPLGAIYMLRTLRAPLAAGIERPNVVDSALLLRRNAYRPALVQRLGQRDDYFRATAVIANAAGVFHLTRALDFAAMPTVLAWLEAHWREMGLSERAA